MPNLLHACCRNDAAALAHMTVECRACTAGLIRTAEWAFLISVRLWLLSHALGGRVRTAMFELTGSSS